MLLRLATLALALGASAAAAAAAPLAVPVSVDETAGVARHGWPAAASVPLPRARVRTADAVWLARPDGRPVAAQTSVLERWPDGSIRWLLVDFLADVPRGSHATYTLRDGNAPTTPPGARLRLTTARDGGRMLDTGVLRATVPGDGAVLLTDVSAGAARLAGPVALPSLRIDGSSGAPPSRERIAVESEGPVRTELVLRGRYPSGVAFEARIAAFAGQPFLRVRHTVTNMADAHYAPVRSLALVAPARLTEGSLGIDGRVRTFAPLDRAHELRHGDATPAFLDGEPAGRHADGWARGQVAGGALTVVGTDFWQQYPKALGVGPDGITVDLFAGRDAPVQLGTGAAKTHEVWIALQPADGAMAADDLAAALGAPLLGLPPASWIVETRALPQALSPEAPGARDFLARLAAAQARYRERVQTERWDDGPPVPCEERKQEHPRVGLYGLFNWGDWQFPGYRDRTRGCDGWGNLEYDLPQVLGLAWAATGSRPFLDGLLPAARHYRDVDIIHHAPGHRDWVGLNHPHKALHFAFESKETVDLGHTWSEGLVTFYRLTGEVRALEAARGIADALVARVSRARNPRQLGWPMIALMAVHDATGERRYLDAASAYAEAAIASFRPTPAAGDWKMGILADGVSYVHAATGDERLRRWLTSYADAFLADPARWPDTRYALPLGYLAALTGDARYAGAALTAARDLKIGEWGKPLAAAGRTGFRLLGPLATRTDLRQAVPPRPAPVRPLPKPREGPRRPK